MPLEETYKVYPSISPVKTHLRLNPGETYTGTFRVGNNGDEAFRYKIYADPYQETDENGSVNYSERNNYTRIVDWITFDTKDGDVAPGEIDTITYTITVPDDAPGGGQYAALIVEAKNEPDHGGAQVNTITRVASIVYAQVAGETRECAMILDDQVNTFMLEPPISANSLVENCGNIDVDASYTLNVYSVFDGQKIFTTAEAPLSRTILPGTKSFNTTSWTAEEGAPALGIYRVEQIVNIGKESATTKATVIVAPIWILIISSLFLLSLIFWLASRIQSRRESRRSSVNTQINPKSP